MHLTVQHSWKLFQSLIGISYNCSSICLFKHTLLNTGCRFFKMKILPWSLLQLMMHMQGKSENGLTEKRKLLWAIFPEQKNSTNFTTIWFMVLKYWGTSFPSFFSFVQTLVHTWNGKYAHPIRQIPSESAVLSNVLEWCVWCGILYGTMIYYIC